MLFRDISRDRPSAEIARCSRSACEGEAHEYTHKNLELLCVCCSGLPCCAIVAGCKTAVQARVRQTSRIYRLISMQWPEFQHIRAYLLCSTSRNKEGECLRLKRMDRSLMEYAVVGCMRPWLSRYYSKYEPQTVLRLGVTTRDTSRTVHTEAMGRCTRVRARTRRDHTEILSRVESAGIALRGTVMTYPVWQGHWWLLQPLWPSSSSRDRRKEMPKPTSPP